MSARRPPPPRLSTHDGRYGDYPDRRSQFHGSNNTQPHSPYSMSPRKRPAGSRSRGNSPPEKRRVASYQDTYADQRKPGSFPSPPASRRSSAAAPPTGPRSEQHRSKATERTERQTRDAPVSSHDARITSPRSFGSGASTPVANAAPTVPSMVPQAGSSVPTPLLARIQQHDTATSTNSQPTMDSLRKARARHKAIALNVKAPSMAIDTVAPGSNPVSIPLESTVKELQDENAELKKELLAISERVTKLEQRPMTNPAMLTKVEELSISFEKLNCDNAEQAKKVQHVLLRQAAVEISVEELPTLKTEVSSMNDWKKSVPTTDEVNKLLLDHSEQHKQLLKVASDRHDKGLKDVGNDVAVIKTWKGSQPTESVTRPFIHEEVVTQVKAALKNTGSSNATTKTELREVEQELKKHTDSSVAKLAEKHSELIRHVNQHIGPAKKAYESTGRSLVERMDKIEAAIASLWGKFAQSLIAAPVRSPSEPIDDTTSSSAQIGYKIKGLSKLNSTSEDLTSAVTQVEERLQRAESQLQILNNRGTSREEVASELAEFKNHVNTEFATLRTKFRKHAPDAGETASIHARIDEHDEAIDKIEIDVDDKGLQLSVLQEDIPRRFNDEFDPLNETVQQALRQISENRKDHDDAIAEMAKEFTHLQARTQSAEHSAATAALGTAALKQDLAKVLHSLDEEKTTRSQAIDELGGRSAGKTETAMINRQLDAFNLALRNLQDQYSNITTDDLYQKMVHWFIHSYPGNNTQFLQRLGVMSQDVARLQSRQAQQLSWIPSSSQELQHLLTVGNQSKTSQEDMQKIENACKSAMNASDEVGRAMVHMAEHKRQVQSIETTLAEQQTALQDLKKASSSSANTPAIDDLDASLQGVRSQIDRVEKTSQSQLELLERLEDMYKTLIEPNESLLPFIAQLFTTVLEMIVHLDAVNVGSCAKRALELQYTFDLADLTK